MKISKSLVVLVIAFKFIECSCGEKNNTDDHERTPIQTNKLIGTWRLIEFSHFDSAARKWEYAYGKNPKGFFTYTRTNIVNLNISSDSVFNISEDSAKTHKINLLDWVYNNAMGYFGTYSVDFEKSLIIHHVQGGSLPWYIGTDQPRQFSLKNDTLIIDDETTWKKVLVRAD